VEKILVESTIRSRLHGLDSELEFCDEAGRTLGYFVPRQGSDRDYEWAKGAFTDAELEQARQEPGGRTTAEVLARLGGS
jgi:hypothetical protein